jgi:hypothetical protein
MTSAPSYDERVRRLRSACGCKSGMVTMLAALTAYVVRCLIVPPAGGLGHRLVVGVAVMLTGALVGKCVGLLWARIRLTVLLRAAP